MPEQLCDLGHGTYLSVLWSFLYKTGISGNTCNVSDSSRHTMSTCELLVLIIILAGGVTIAMLAAPKPARHCLPEQIQSIFGHLDTNQAKILA